MDSRIINLDYEGSPTGTTQFAVDQSSYSDAHKTTLDDIKAYTLDGLVTTDVYTSGATFDTVTGILTQTRTDSSVFQVDLDGRYLTGSTGGAVDYNWIAEVGGVPNTITSGTTVEFIEGDGVQINGSLNTDYLGITFSASGATGGGTSGTSGTDGTDGTSGTSGSISGVTSDPDLYYTNDVLYTPQITMTGTTDFTTHPSNYWGLFIDSDTGEVYSNSGATGASGTSGTSGTGGLSITGDTTGQMLYWDGSDWDITLIDSVVSGQALIWNGTIWTNSGVTGSGTSGTSGTNGTDGTDGTSGTNGTNGTDGISGTDGTSGTSGTSGVAPFYDWIAEVGGIPNTITSGTTVEFIEGDGMQINGSLNTDYVGITFSASGATGGGGLTGATDEDFYYTTTTDTLYTPNIVLTGLTTTTPHSNSISLYTDGVGKIFSNHLSPGFSYLRIHVGEDYGFDTLTDTITWLTSNMSGNTTVILETAEETINDTITINLPFNISIRDGILAPGVGLSGKEMFDIQSNTEIIDIKINATGAYTMTENDICFKVSNDVDFHLHEVDVEGFHTGIKSIGSNYINIIQSQIADLECGICVSGSTTIRTLSNIYDNLTRGIDFKWGQGIKYGSQNDRCIIFTGQTYLTQYTGVTGSVTFSAHYLQDMIYRRSEQSIQFSDGFDFARTDGRDADIEWNFNSGLKESRPHASFIMTSNTGVTTIDTQDVWTKMTFASVPDSWIVNKWTINGNNVTYLPQKTDRDCIFWLSGSITTTANPQRTFVIAVVENDLSGDTSKIYGTTEVQTDGSNVRAPWSSPVYLQDVTYGDTFSIYIKNTSSDDDVTLTSMNAFMDSR